jgi:hypothetical protein
MNSNYVMGHIVDQELVDKVTNDLKEKYNNSKSRKFVEFLVKSFLPINPLNRVYEFGESLDKNCCLTRHRLASIKEIIEVAKMARVDDKYIDNLDIICTEDGDRAYSDAIHKYSDTSKVYSNIRNKDLAISASNTNKVLSIEGILALEKFVNEEIKSGNRYLKFLLNNKKPTERVTNKNNSSFKVKKSIPKKTSNSKELVIKNKTTTNKFNSFEDLKELIIK